MGLFDWVNCECPLPGNPKGVLFQTKDFEAPYLDHYTISRVGRLMCDGRDVEYHGMLKFYGSERTGKLLRISLEPDTFGRDLDHPGPEEWFEYRAKFTNGQLIEIQRISGNAVSDVVTFRPDADDAKHGSIH